MNARAYGLVIQLRADAAPPGAVSLAGSWIGESHVAGDARETGDEPCGLHSPDGLDRAAHVGRHAGDIRATA